MKLILIDFTDMSADEQELVLDWRNDSRINQWMLNQKKISKKEHENFIGKLMNDNSNKYWLVKENINGTYLGVIYLNSINNKEKITELGLYINPNFIGKGLGRILLEELKRISREDYRLKKLTLEVFENNVRAINLYKKNGFAEYKLNKQKINIDGKNYFIVKMHIDLI